MGILDQQITDRWAVYNGDSMEVMPQFPDGSIHFSIYSPPFAGLYNYSSDEADVSNARSYDEFLDHYEFFIAEIARLTMPGRLTAVHCMDVPTGNTGCDALVDFPGDIIRRHGRHGFEFVARTAIWKEPLEVRNRTMMKNLAHKTIVEDSSRAANAGADYLLTFRKVGTNPVPIAHPTGLVDYAGEAKPPADLLPYRGWTGNQIENRWSHWIWRKYASSVWMDIRLGNVLPYRQAREEEDERHPHALQLDVIKRATILYSNPSERVLTPFMGVGSEVYEPVKLGRYGIGIELKSAYYRQALKNLATLDDKPAAEAEELFGDELFECLDDLDTAPSDA